jgi:hypothetical protein
MAVNPNISLAVKAPEFIDPMAIYSKIATIQGAQSQNRLAQLQMRQAQREEESTNALNQAYREAYDPVTGNIDPGKLRSKISSLGQGSKLPAIEKSLLELSNSRLTQRKTEGEILDAVTQRYRDTLTRIDPASPTAGVQLMRAHKANHSDPVMQSYLKGLGVDAAEGDAEIEAAIAKGSEGIADFIQRSSLRAKDFHDFNKPKWVPTGNQQVPVSEGTGKKLTNVPALDIKLSPDAAKPVINKQNDGKEEWLVSTPAGGGPATEVPGSRYKIGMSPYQSESLKNDRQRISLEGERVGLEGRRVAVAEEQDRRAKDPVFQQRMAEARKTGEDIAKGTVAAQQALPKVISRAEEGLRLIDEMIGKRDDKGKLLPGQKVHPGFGNAVGFGLPFRFVPGTSESDFQARFDQIKGASFLEAFESLKGGGAITKEEGEKATVAINRMGLAQSEQEFISAARDLQEVVRKGIVTQQRKAGGGTTSSPVAPQSSVTGAPLGGGTPPPPPGFKRD